LINQLRAILLERGIVFAKGRQKLKQELAELMDEGKDSGLSERLVKLIEDMRTQWRELDRRIGEFDAEFTAFAKTNEDARFLSPGRLSSIRRRWPCGLSTNADAGKEALEAFDAGPWGKKYPSIASTGGLFMPCRLRASAHLIFGPSRLPSAHQMLIDVLLVSVVTFHDGIEVASAAILGLTRKQIDRRMASIADLTRGRLRP
jgi:hypothetical protein